MEFLVSLTSGRTDISTLTQVNICIACLACNQRRVQLTCSSLRVKEIITRSFGKKRGNEVDCLSNAELHRSFGKLPVAQARSSSKRSKPTTLTSIKRCIHHPIRASLLQHGHHHNLKTEPKCKLFQLLLSCPPPTFGAHH